MLLVTGGNGFIATDLARRLRADQTAFRLAARQGADDIVGVSDINPETDWSSALADVSTVVHLAGIAHRTSNQPELEEFRRVNVAGTAQLARQAMRAGARRFVFISSIGVLGQTTKAGDQFSDHSAANPVTPYAVSKHEAEIALSTLCRNSPMELVILRPPLVYGYGARGNFGRLVELVAKGYPLPLLSVKNRRSMVSIGSLTRAIIACATKPEAANETFVVADRSPLSTPEIIRAIATGLQTKTRLFPFPPSIIETALRTAGRSTMAEGLFASLEVDASRIAERLDWRPEADTSKTIQAQFNALAG